MVILKWIESSLAQVQLSYKHYFSPPFLTHSIIYYMVLLYQNIQFHLLGIVLYSFYWENSHMLSRKKACHLFCEASASQISYLAFFFFNFYFYITLDFPVTWKSVGDFFKKLNVRAPLWALEAQSSQPLNKLQPTKTLFPSLPNPSFWKSFDH